VQENPKGEDVRGHPVITSGNGVALGDALMRIFKNNAGTSDSMNLEKQFLGNGNGGFFN
jgi:hypothetical protein